MPPKEEMDFRVYQVQMANSMTQIKASHPLFISLLSTSDYQSNHDECTVAHNEQTINHTPIVILKYSIGGIPYFRLLSISYFFH